ncbi:hypothetical protein VTL71DRAFT_16135 [Oculimacula yallundae]|uniref:Reverse transcriptase domain-containing protein n=1 Tax=Oculimacula yallundae TaxID=86028 RepID=A0ABR4CEB2_9HELO
MRMKSIDKWQWDSKGVAVEQRRLLNGRSRFFHDDELLQAMLLRYIGVRWSVHLKATLTDFRSTIGVWKSASAPVSPRDQERRNYFLSGPQLQSDCTVESIRTDHFQDKIFLEQLPSTVAEVRGSYDDDRIEKGDTRESSLQMTQTLLHTLATEIIIKRALGQEMTVVRTDFASFGPSLPHLTITTVLKALGVSYGWVDFFRRQLEAPVKFMEDGPNPSVHIRKRGTPPSSPMSDFMAEAVLFCLDFSFNQQTDGARMYRMHDDIWLWGSEKNCIAGWDVMIKFAQLTGLGFSREKTGSVTITRRVSQATQTPSPLPHGNICWGFLKLDAAIGRFLVDQDLIEKHIEELRLQLEACKSVIEYLQAWNVYGVRFFANNMGTPANCFGLMHVEMMLKTFRGIQTRLFGSAEYSAIAGSAVNDVTSTLQKMIKERFGVDVPEGYFFYPTTLGGLDLKNPFITLGLIQKSITKKPESIMDYFFREENADYLKAKTHYEKFIVPAQENLSKKDLAKIKFAGARFMSLAEFCRNREQTSELLGRVYKSLMREPAEQPVIFTPDISGTLSRKDWDGYTHYHQRVIQLYANDIIPRFSGLNIVQQGWLPTGMVSMFRESRFQWKD